MSNRVLSFHYVLTNVKGEQIDSSRQGEPFAVLEGRKQIIPGLEEALFKMAAGEKKKIHVPADRAYGQKNEKLKLKVNRKQLPDGDLKVGSQFTGGDPGQGPVFTVIKIDGDEIHLDGNHHLAGQDLTFDVEIMEVREATAEELTHGHAHGAHGHHH